MAAPENLRAEIAVLQQQIDEARRQVAELAETLNEVSAGIDDLRGCRGTTVPQRHPFVDGFLGAFRLAGKVVSALWRR